MRRQVTQETTTTRVATMAVCQRMCDYHHEHLEEEERLTTMVTATGDEAQGEGCHYDTMTGSTIMVTTMQDRLQERFERKRTTTSSDYIIRLTDRLLRLGEEISDCFSHFQPRKGPIFQGLKPPFVSPHWDFSISPSRYCSSETSRSLCCDSDRAIGARSCTTFAECGRLATGDLAHLSQEVAF